MSRTIYKYELVLPSDNDALGYFRAPRGFELLHVAEQGRGKFFAWGVVDPGEKNTTVEFLVRGTGHDIDPELLERPWKHRQTVLAMGGALVLHFWVGL